MPESAVLWGCVAAIILSAIQSLGITLQRKSHIIPYPNELSVNSVVDLRRDSVITMDPESSTKTHNYRRNLWLVGFLLFIFANIFGSLVQLTALPLIILSPLQSIGLIFNSILSCVLLPGENFTKKLAGGTAAIALGAFTIAYNGVSVLPPDENLGADERFRMALQKFLQPGFLTWWGFTFLYTILLVRINWLISNSIKKLEDRPCRRMGRSVRVTKDHTSNLVFAKGIIYGVISGTLTAHTFLLAKSLVDVIFQLMMERSTPKSLTTYVITTILLSFTLLIVCLQLTAFNLGLSNILTSVLYPLCFLVYNMINLFNDLFFNKLLSSGYMSIGQLVFVILGLSGVLYGVVLISWDSAYGQHEVIIDNSQPLLITKFPYDQGWGGVRKLSYEESELLCQLSGNFRLLDN